ncbi:uncharacterized protein BO97DRAFT_473387 [Aspergillus homomorphus CBS 101889]|uniref:Uncharacterized protein n=1 Tax=Aspergillus homomorphus (strain CBS 101889) TaxID=1450537 RepID=A0A395HJ40_ASPHC|nr:hypothetical protein BO97DRAFT_473387 [Aspergillus homomorphus CBS 101889]RAL07790.1 hypothetical protein BO97DRAFT_473387 [Aspergillus homomorphus CBS 101889]
MHMQAAITWPPNFQPGKTDKFVSNEIYIRDTTLARIWVYLSTITKRETYYDNFSTFGFPPLQAEVCESVPPTDTVPGRLAWRAWQDGDDDSASKIYHAWIVEKVPWGRGVVRVLTQESQIGKPAALLAGQKPNPMLNGYQAWLGYYRSCNCILRPDESSI